MIVEIESISPVHIGSGAKISPLEYWIQDVFVRLDMDALFKDQRFAPVCEDFIQASAASRYIGDLLPETLFHDHCLYWVPFAPEAGAHLATNRIEVHEFVKTSGRVYLPGSSIKGAILSAAVHHVLCELYPKASHQKKIEDLLRNPTRRTNHQNPIDLLMNLVFGHFSKSAGGKKGSRFHPWIKVSDTTLATPDQALQIVKTEVQGAKTGKALPVICEAVRMGKNFAVELQSVADLRWNISDLLKIADRFYRAVWERTMPDNAPENGCLLRLGLGSSAYATSLLVFAEQHGIGPEIYRLLPPRTRKVAEANTAMGWVLIEDKDNEDRLFVSGANEMRSTPMPMPEKIPSSGALADPALSRVMIKTPPKRPAPVVLKRDTKTAELLKQIELIKTDDAFAFRRLVEAMDNLEDEHAQRTVAEALKNKLVEAGKWNKHRLRTDIEFYLSSE
jgi:hypothetical protein